MPTPTPTMTVSPTAIPFIPFGTAVVTVTGTGTTWTGATGWNVVSGASNTGSTVNGTQFLNQATQQAQIVISPGSDPGAGTATITIADNTDAATCTLTVLGSTYVAPALVAGTLTATTTAATGATLSLAGVSGGIAPYSVQFQQAPDADGSPGTWTNLGTASATTTTTASGLPVATRLWFRASVTDSGATPATATTTAVSLTTATLSDADADLVASRLLGMVGALEPGRTFAQSFRKILASAAGDIDLTSVPGYALFRLSDGTEAFRVAATGRTTVTEGANL